MLCYKGSCFSLIEADVKYGYHISDVTELEGQWKVTCWDGTSEMFDCVILTMPTPQILQLQGTISTLIGEWMSQNIVPQILNFNKSILNLPLHFLH